MPDFATLEPIAGAGLAISLAYLALERFRYRRDVETVSSVLHEKYENDAQLGEDQTLEHLQELKWLCRRPCNGHSPSGAWAWFYGVFFRRHFDIWLVTLLAVMSAFILVQGVAGLIGVTAKFTYGPALKLAFLFCFLAMSIPGGAVLLGRWTRAKAIERAHKCDDQIAHALKISAKEAQPPRFDPTMFDDEIPF